jgi:alcohol dehydrogenase (NADP+)
MSTQHITFAGDGNMPSLGLGTWKSTPGEVGGAVRKALELGYRHFDCAAIYGNEAEIGEALAGALRKGVVARDELWITSKLWNDRHATEDVLPALENTLKDLRLDYLDLYLVHWPVTLRKDVHFPELPTDFIGPDVLPLAATWAGMEATVDAGLARHIGVSNFSAAKLQTVLADARLRPEVNQVEMHPYLAQNDLVAYCRENEIHVTAYSPLGSIDRPKSMKQADEPVLLEDEAVLGVASRTGCSAAQVLLAWALQRGTSVIPKSVHPGRMEENLAASELTLAPADTAALDALDRHRRYVTGGFWVKEGGPYTLSNLWDE